MTDFKTQNLILIEDLQIQTVIGAFAWERAILQPLLVSLVIGADLSAAAQSDALSDALNYRAICEFIKDFVIQKKAHLLEHLAASLIEALFAEFPAILTLELTLKKPLAIPNTQAVGVKMCRNRP